MESKAFVQMLVDQMTSEIAANGALGKLTRNTSLIGNFAESTVRRMICRIVAPLRVSHGSVIYEDNCGTNDKSKPPQIDTIIWSPCPVPAVFEVGDFALVPRGSAVAMLEIKSTNYSGASTAIEEVCNLEGPLMCWEREHQQPDQNDRRAMGVICVRTEKKDDKLDELTAAARAVTLLKYVDADTLKPCPRSIAMLVNFLMRARGRAKALDGSVRLNLDLLDE